MACARFAGPPHLPPTNLPCNQAHLPHNCVPALVDEHHCPSLVLVARAHASQDELRLLQKRGGGLEAEVRRLLSAGLSAPLVQRVESITSTHPYPMTRHNSWEWPQWNTPAHQG